ncbi:hypothetical protein TTHERM_00985190 (macronuclear) [Tetrahymena thermophila SB210]|uniref:Uncharacterized protein n=1 Tax=Tetrahymena thermophila (strain SB210) TaxID=312017 RepID=Q233V9_TETTS|nr:hypothetical protein TTHERM_00985190 [Tetrahymena thermophila SB210]EAR91825.2 hypothetical protein TTHERM_00985190 [Tetrahymena thermophila SB210]|eukprot:XP_001012070.2 hypothetical protein TTHERM_00985190 [Tetrahymena thermophila SB210]
MKITKKEQKILEKQALKDNQKLIQEEKGTNNQKLEESQDQQKQIVKSKKRSNKKLQESLSGSDESQSLDNIQKKQKNDKNKQIEGSFQIKGFDWYQKENNDKKFMKIQREFIPQNFLKVNLDDLKKRKEISQNTHKQIIQYFETGSCFKDSYFTDDQNEFLQFQVKIIQEYLQKRQMSIIQPNQTIKYLQTSKKVDLICQNDQECIIVCFLVTKRTPELNIICDFSYHYLDLIEAQEEMLNQKKKVTVLIVPLLMLNNFRIIEFDKEEIIQMQQDQEQRTYFQCNYSKYLESYLFRDVSILLEQCELGRNPQEKKTVYQFIKDLDRQKNIKEIEQYQNFDNAPKRFNPRNRECMNMEYKKQFQQFYLVATILQFKYKNFILSKASQLINNQPKITNYYTVEANNYPIYESELF